MKIEFTEEEYKALLDMIYLSEWMMHSHCNADSKLDEKYTQLRRKILSHYQEMNAAERYTHDEDEFYEEEQYERMLHEKYVQKYNELTLWDELATRLTQKKIALPQQVSPADVTNIDEKLKSLVELEQKYHELFKKQGIDAINVVID